MWQRQRKQAKRDYMRLVARYEAELKEAVEYGLDSHHHPEPPEDPDFGELEEQHQMARMNLERLSARRISCVSLIENLLQYLRVCSLVFPSRALAAADEAAKPSVADMFNVYGSPNALSPRGRGVTTVTTDDIHAHLELLTDIDEDDETKFLWLQLCLWLEASSANIDFM